VRIEPHDTRGGLSEAGNDADSRETASGENDWKRVLFARTTHPIGDESDQGKRRAHLVGAGGAPPIIDLDDLDADARPCRGKRIHGAAREKDLRPTAHAFPETPELIRHHQYAELPHRGTNVPSPRRAGPPEAAPARGRLLGLAQGTFLHAGKPECACSGDR
jgi:hypothetical protein